MLVAVDQFILKNRVPHLLFYGPPGTGKTSTILAVARKIYGTKEAMKNNCLEVSHSHPTPSWEGSPVDPLPETELANARRTLCSSTRLTTAGLTSFGSRSRTLRRRG